MSVKQFFQKDIEEMKINIDKEKLKIFLIVVVTSVIVHFQLYSLILTGPDTLINSMYHQANVWEVMLLRFGLCVVQALKGSIVSPLLSTLISSILLGITVIVVTDLLQIKNKYFKIITAIVFAVAPNFSATLTFFYCSDAYILGMLLSCLAVFLIRKYENKKSMVIFSGLLITMSISLYQTYLAVTMVLCVATLIIDLLNNAERKQILKNLIRYILMGIIGIIVFYGVAHLILYLAKLPVSNYSGANKIGLETLKSLPTLIPESYQSFFNYYFNDKMIPNTVWHTNILYIIIFAVMLISTITIIVKNKVYKNIVNMISLLILFIIAPICFGVVEIIAPDVDIHILMACAMIFVFPIFFKILEMLPKTINSNVLKNIMLICSIGIIWIYIWQDNASYIAMNTMQNQAVQTAERILTRIEELDGFNSDMPILFLGGLKDNSYLNRDNTPMETKRVFDKSWGFVAKEPTVWWGNLDSWIKLYYEYIGVNLNLVSEWVSGDIFETEEYKNMTYYPENDSIKIIKDTVVVKLSD